MVDTFQSAFVLLALAGMAAVMVWVVVTAGPAVDMSAVLSLSAFQSGESAPASAPAVLGARDAIGARPVEVVDDYPAVRLPRAQSVFAP